jgi:competence protein ComEA
VLGLFFCYQSIVLVTASSDGSAQKDTFVSSPEISPTAHEKIYVDLTGSVVEPKTYQVDSGTRLFQLIELAGGLSVDADKSYIQRNYNFSIVLSDQQKIHIPSVYEVRDGYFTEIRRVVSLDATEHITRSSTGQANETSIVSINNSNMETLKSLAGVGDVTAQRIIAGRPYQQVQDLVDKGIIKQSLLDKIFDRLEL